MNKKGSTSKKNTKPKSGAKSKNKKNKKFKNIKLAILKTFLILCIVIGIGCWNFSRSFSRSC